MDFSNKLIGVDFNDLSLNHLKNYFKIEREESDILEFKSFFQSNQNKYREKEKAILKTICGFLNSNGGLLIWGAPVGVKNDTSRSKVFIGDLSPVDKKMEKDDFISKIANRIIPVTHEVKFKRIEFETNKFIYVFRFAGAQLRERCFRFLTWKS